MQVDEQLYFLKLNALLKQDPSNRFFKSIHHGAKTGKPLTKNHCRAIDKGYAKLEAEA